MYLQQSLKQYERDLRSKLDAINITISREDQPLPVEMERFWSSSENKVNLQQFFIRWMIKTYTDVTLYMLVDLIQMTSRVKIFKGTREMVCLLKCDHEEADDRMMFHINHAVNVDQLSRAIVASEDTYVFICLIYHFSRWIHFGMQELWVLKGQGTSKRSVPVHDLLDKMDSSI